MRSKVTPAFASFLLSISLVSFLMSSGSFAAGRGIAGWVGDDLSGRPCQGSVTGLGDGFGPYDYRLDQDKLPVVERAHFSRKTELLMYDTSIAGGHASGGIDYTLGKFPNHHRALNSAVLLSFRDVSGGEALKRPAVCYLQRAVDYAPDDATVHMLLAMYLHKAGRLEQANRSYTLALELSPNSANIEYNHALLLIDMGRIAEAKEKATKLYSNDFPLPGLRRKLVSKGHWE